MKKILTTIALLLATFTAIAGNNVTVDYTTGACSFPKYNNLDWLETFNNCDIQGTYIVHSGDSTLKKDWHGIVKRSYDLNDPSNPIPQWVWSNQKGSGADPIIYPTTAFPPERQYNPSAAFCIYIEEIYDQASGSYITTKWFATDWDIQTTIVNPDEGNTTNLRDIEWQISCRNGFEFQ